MKNPWKRVMVLGCGMILALATAGNAGAHCDTLEGPVAKEAFEALQKGRVEPVLKWVRREDEAEVRKAFERALRTRKLGPEAQETADLYFIEILVRLHRASEGEPFTGVKPAGTVLEPGIRESDEALAKGSAESLAADLGTKTGQVVREKFRRVLEAKKHAKESVGAGRRFVAAYVDFLHTVEHLSVLSQEHSRGRSEHPDK